MPTYFYLCSYPLAPGSIVNPGNWGRIISTYTPPNFGNPWILVRELVAESIRLARYPSKPDRMKSIFVCEDLPGAQKFKIESSRQMDLIFEVELVNSAAPLHRGDYTLMNVTNGYTLETLHNRAEIYWRDPPPHSIEIVTTSPIKIIRTV